MLWNYLNNFDNMLHVNFDILLGCFFVTCVWLQFAEQTNPLGGVKYEIFLDIWAIKLFTWNCVIITSLLFCKPIRYITHRTNRGESWYTSSPVSMPNVHFITFDWQKSTMLFCLPVSLPLKSPIKCLFIDNWFAGVPFLSYRYFWQNKFAFVFNNHVLLPVTRSDKTWNVSELVRLQGCSFITLLSWLTTEFSHQNLFRHVLMRNWGSVCHSWFDFSVSVAHLRCCVRSAGRRGEFFFSLKEIPVSDRSDTFMTLKKCLCGGEVETVFYSKSCSGSIAQSIKSLFTGPTEGGSKIFFWLQLAVVDLRRYLIFAYAP